MKVAIVYWDPKDGDLKEFAKALSQGVESQGHQVHILDAAKEDIRLTGYDYLLIGSAPQSVFSGKLSPKVVNGIARAGTLTGKRCFAFVRKRGFRSFKVLQGLMHRMEAEGMMLKFSEILTSPEEAKYLASKLHIKK